MSDKWTGVFAVGGLVVLVVALVGVPYLMVRLLTCGNPEVRVWAFVGLLLVTAIALASDSHDPMPGQY